MQSKYMLEILFEKFKVELFTLRLDHFSQGWRSTVEDLHFPLILLFYFLENLK